MRYSRGASLTKLFFSGCALQISTKEERMVLFDSLESLLNRLHNPYLITVARSAVDGYTPDDQVADIQLEFFKSLDRVYGRGIITVCLDYDGWALVLYFHFFSCHYPFVVSFCQSKVGLWFSGRAFTWASQAGVPVAPNFFYEAESPAQPIRGVNYTFLYLALYCPIIFLNTKLQDCALWWCWN